MKKTLTLLCCLFFTAFYSNAQSIFWTENFESGASTDAAGLPTSYTTGPNGAWTLTVTGTEDVTYNQWYVSCAENGHTAGICGSGCVATSSTATLATLHIGAYPFSVGDMGASYDAGGGLPFSTTTDRRAESPTINCTGKTTITISFNYIENGQGTTDNATLWYYDGTTWSLLDDPAKTPLCGAQGQWTHYTHSLPASANNNPNVKIGFRWVNNNDGLGTDPSFAVDSVSLSVPGATPVASFTTSPTPATICTDSCLTLTSTSTISSGTIDSIRWVGVILGFPVLLGNTNPYSFCTTAPYNVPGTYTIRLRVYGGGTADSTTSTVTINRSPKPAMTKTGKVLSVPSTGYLSYKWYNASGPIAGATTSTYTYSVGGTYTVIVDSGGCKGSASMTVAGAGVTVLSGTENSYWLSQQDNGAVILHSSELTDEALSVNLYDATGRRVVNTIWTKGTNMKELKDLSLSPGLYFIKISNQTNAAVLKLLRQ